MDIDLRFFYSLIVLIGILFLILMTTKYFKLEKIHENVVNIQILMWPFKTGRCSVMQSYNNQITRMPAIFF